ncbi:alpha/beta fold hydrolase [Actinoplanes friuliensis]|uniref:2-hydroxy-6-ketonona-2,4-dienedioic acid hydrolase n=1 Tax=Actinoplanes friuliensis DSM 7358 TaxID=1246995 RepID=U5VYT9_9ACTN|nr:alpha/beta fold hydrolase [Actinoplanes friuliensis]AGZ40895.1 2-hydroxy-6-ketonona-2,4-dienedioic acid hydrolase [Actinoplanes friuliensis DSM 7358]
MTTSVDLGDTEVAYTESGTGPAVIWLHGSGPGATGMSNFGGNLPAFADHRNIALDLPGWGRSPRTTDEPLLFHAAKTVSRVMTALGIERAHLVGNSYGGGVAMRLAITEPDRVGRLVLMAPGGVLPPDAPPWPVGLEHLFGYMAAEKPSREAMAEFVRLMVYDQALATDALIDERYRSSLAVHPELPIPPNFGDLTPDLPRIRARTLLIWGREDQTVPLTWAARILNDIPDAELRVLPHCRHWVQYERAAEFNHIVREFLSGGDPSATSNVR